ncbi:hypothetical protein AV530_019661 [Patagioenas fasciata monilis]|uniref:Uncharacterized protein n=1 Tax=Patagioenas fasciata monilis TaxID=372326 RepID=A0A1V4JE56_PATFA|nr:hypothetical protein AV530_019661 [Patagioenas fasciata monilis]
MEAKTTFKIATRGTSICNVAEDVSNNGTLIELGFNIHKQSFKCRWLSEDARLKLEKPVRALNRQQVLKPNSDPLIAWHYKRIKILWRPFMMLATQRFVPSHHTFRYWCDKMEERG